jgi:SAM-dependent methyltransferase
LEVGALEGDFLEKIQANLNGNLSRVEMNSVAASIAQAQISKIIEASTEEVTFASFGRHFNVIYLGQVFEHLEKPLEVLTKLQRIPKPGGVIIVTTPNLDSKQREFFCPIWARWHAPYHRNIFSPKSLENLAELSGLKVKRLTCHPHGYWTGLSFALHSRGVGGYVSQFSKLGPLTCLRFQKIALLSNLTWDPIKKGD